MVHSATKISPESAPSISATSTTTSSSYVDQVVRELFPEIPTPKSHDLVLKDLHLRNQISSDVASSNESISSDDSQVYVKSIDLTGPNHIIEEQRRHHNDAAFPGCHGTIDLSTKNLATMFNIFDTSQQEDTYLYNDITKSTDAISTSNSSVMNDAATEVVSNIDHSIVYWERKIDSLQREITTLKGIIKADSVTILRLKTELAMLCETGTECRSSDLSNLSDNNSVVSANPKQSSDDIIELAHEEIEVQTKNMQADRNNKSFNDYQQLQLENELFAAQIITNESEIRETRDIISQIAEENMKLSAELSEMRLQQSKESEDENVDLVTTYKTIKAEIVCMTNWMADMEHKLKTGYYCNCCRCLQQDHHIIPNQEVAGPQLQSNALEDESCEAYLPTMLSNDPTQVNESEIEVTADGAIITTTGIEGIHEEFNEQLATCHSSSNTNNAGQSYGTTIKNNPEIVDTNCNFCGCLRATNKNL